MLINSIIIVLLVFKVTVCFIDYILKNYYICSENRVDICNNFRITASTIRKVETEILTIINVLDL